MRRLSSHPQCLNDDFSLNPRSHLGSCNMHGGQIPLPWLQHRIEVKLVFRKDTKKDKCYDEIGLSAQHINNIKVIIKNRGWHNIIHSYNGVMRNWQYYEDYSSHSYWLWGIFLIILPVMLNTVMALNNVINTQKNQNTNFIRCLILVYRRFIAGLTLNNSKKEV